MVSGKQYCPSPVRNWPLEVGAPKVIGRRGVGPNDARMDRRSASTTMLDQATSREQIGDRAWGGPALDPRMLLRQHGEQLARAPVRVSHACGHQELGEARRDLVRAVVLSRIGRRFLDLRRKHLGNARIKTRMLLGHHALAVIILRRRAILRTLTTRTLTPQMFLAARTHFLRRSWSANAALSRRRDSDPVASRPTRERSSNSAFLRASAPK